MSILKNKLFQILKKTLNYRGKFNANLKINSIKQWDSLGNFNFLLEIEKELKIKFSTIEFTELTDFKSIYKSVKKKITK